MRHARADDLEPVSRLLDQLRTVEGLTEKKQGTFYRGSVAFLHFHVDLAGMFADVKVDGCFERFRASTVAEQRTVLAVARKEVSRRGGSRSSS
jgi:hypothetical protein